VVLTDGRTDRRRTLTHDKSSHGLWPGELKKRILNDRVFYFLSTAIVILIVIVIELIITNMAARVHNVFSLAEILKIFLSETTKSIEL
jgi:hypothetical protein